MVFIEQGPEADQAFEWISAELVDSSPNYGCSGFMAVNGARLPAWQARRPRASTKGAFAEKRPQISRTLNKSGHQSASRARSSRFAYVGGLAMPRC